MDCACHGEPMWWQPDRRRPPGGYWRCGVARQQADSKDKKGRQLRYWHKANGGYIRRRKRDLAAERVQLLARLDNLEQEALRAEP